MTNVKAEMSNKTPMTNDKKTYDLEERTAIFGEDIIVFAKTLKRDDINRPLISQIVRSGTSIGANYMEADAAESKRDFKHKISLVKKETKETKHWLRMIAKANPQRKEELKVLWNEGQELTLIFSAILNKMK